jgi:dihydroorotate dehydrogenase
MPDWTYHPFFKHLLFRLPPEEARRLTLRVLEIQARTSLGRRVFRLFGHGLPPEELKVNVFGLCFPGPVGLAPGIDTEGTTLSVMQHLGFGFIEVGPVGEAGVARTFKHDPLRLKDQWSLVHSPHAGGPSAAQLANRIASTPELSIPVGIALRGSVSELCGALRVASEAASFFTLPASCSADLDEFSMLRQATSKPLLIRVPADWDPHLLDKRLDQLVERGLNGCVATSGASCGMLDDGEIDGPFLSARALRTVEHIVRRYDERLPVIGAGGVMSPENCLSLLDAGAKLVELYAGLVFAGPGLPGRIVHALEHRMRHSSTSGNGWVSAPAGGWKGMDNAICLNPETTTEPVAGAVADSARPKPNAFSVADKLGKHAWTLLAFNGVVLIGSGLFALLLALTVKFLPYDLHYLGMTVDQLCRYYDCRIVHFMSHDRVSFGGSIIAIGALYVWLATSPLRRGEAWSWWTFLISGIIGFGSFLTYLGYGYLDVTHAIATLMLLPLFIGGLVLTFSTLRSPRGLRTVLRPGASAWQWSPAGQGRALLLFTSAGMILGGATIMTVGMTHVFVPQDLEFMGLAAADLSRINPRLVSMIAHDRAGFGGGLCSTGLAILLTVWCGARPGAKGLWRVWLISGLTGFATAIGVHPVVGYTSFTHLAPAYIGAIAFLAGMILLYQPMCRTDEPSNRFPDF